MADGGFPTDNGILTPVPVAWTGSKEEAYNAAHRAARQVNRRTVAEMRQRWRCLAKRLHYVPQMTARIVYCAAILHNVCAQRGIALNEDAVQAQLADDEDDDENGGDQMLENNEDEWNDEAEPDEGLRVRNEYIAEHF